MGDFKILAALAVFFWSVQLVQGQKLDSAASDLVKKKVQRLISKGSSLAASDSITIDPAFIPAEGFDTTQLRQTGRIELGKTMEEKPFRSPDRIQPDSLFSQERLNGLFIAGQCV